MRIGALHVCTVDEWQPTPGALFSWGPTPSSRAKALDAPVSEVPPSYVQARHLRSLRDQAARGLDHSRLLIASVEVAGRCDLRAMSYVINTHLRRHDTYRSWFEYQSDSPHGGRFVRHTIADPADIEFVLTDHGEFGSAALCDHIVAIPDSLHWECFGFGIIQRAETFTFFASIDHLHADGHFVGMGLMEFQAMYAELIKGNPPVDLPPPGSYDDFCLRQRTHTGALTADSPQVRAWADFAERNDGTFPRFPLPLGAQSAPYDGDLISLTLLDEGQTERFETACVAAGARFVGGMFACIALALNELTGAATYYAITPVDTRSTQADLTTQGWFTGQIPVTVPVAGLSFNEIAQRAQASFDSGTELARVPFERVVELEPSLRPPPPLFSLVNFFDAQASPLSMMTKLLEGMTVGAHSDGRVTYPLSTMVGRYDQTAASVLLPGNAVARDSVGRYLAAIKSACVRIADGGPDERERVVARAFTPDRVLALER